MSARVWTREELDRVHPLPDGWAWSLKGSDPVATSGDLEVLADTDIYGQGRESAMSSIPVGVALSVILAAKGLDSYEAMAAVIEQRAEYFDDGARKVNSSSQARAANIASSKSMRMCAAMLRRGTVEP